MTQRVCHHGVTRARGCQHLRLGHFDKLFVDPKTGKEIVPPRQIADPHGEARLLGGKNGIMDDRKDDSGNSRLPAGYTFFAQFVDHDITLDTGSNLEEAQRTLKEVREVGNIRSPALDLDCVYGFGPDANPHLYENSAGRLKTGNDVNPNDLPRNDSGTALIGDPRNDENVFVSQLQLLFLRFHNKVLDSLIGVDGDRFEAAQTKVRQHYQYIVLHDFLKRICHEEVFDWAVQQAEKAAKGQGKGKGGKGFPRFFGPDKHGKLPMPVEFSVAAYRFGHTLVRARYAANGAYPDIDIFDEMFGTLGFSAVPPNLTVDWALLLDVDPGRTFLRSKQLDHLLASELIELPNPVVGRRASDDERSLAFRNLVRGHVMGLPSGQDAAKALKGAGYPAVDPKLDLELADIVDDKKLRERLKDSAPLFFYVLREAGVTGGERLGPVGSAILLEVFLGILLHCENTILQDENFELDQYIAPNRPDFELADIVRFVG